MELPVIPEGKSKIGTDEEKRNIWHQQQELLLKSWGDLCSSYRWLHDRSYQIYRTRNFRYMVPIIIISTVTGTANFSQESFPESAFGIPTPMIIGGFNLVSAVATTIYQFLKISESMEGHRMVSISFGKLKRNIALELNLPLDERSSGGVEFVRICKAEMDRLIEQSPNIPKKVLTLFMKKFGKNNMLKPEILQISPIIQYEGDTLIMPYGAAPPASMATGGFGDAWRNLCQTSQEIKLLDIKGQVPSLLPSLASRIPPSPVEFDFDATDPHKIITQGSMIMSDLGKTLDLCAGLTHGNVAVTGTSGSLVPAIPPIRTRRRRVVGADSANTSANTSANVSEDEENPRVPPPIRPPTPVSPAVED